MVHGNILAMSKKKWADRFVPLKDTVLVRKPGRELRGGLKLAEADADSGKMIVRDASTIHNKGIVVSFGPGDWEYGVFVKTDEKIAVGKTVLFDAQQSFQLNDVPEMKEEGLWIVSSRGIIGLEGV